MTLPPGLAGAVYQSFAFYFSFTMMRGSMLPVTA
jgi:hypothetical protein